MRKPVLAHFFFVVVSVPLAYGALLMTGAALELMTGAALEVTLFSAPTLEPAEDPAEGPAAEPALAV